MGDRLARFRTGTSSQILVFRKTRAIRSSRGSYSMKYVARKTVNWLISQFADVSYLIPVYCRFFLHCWTCACYLTLRPDGYPAVTHLSTVSQWQFKRIFPCKNSVRNVRKCISKFNISYQKIQGGTECVKIIWINFSRDDGGVVAVSFGVI